MASALLASLITSLEGGSGFCFMLGFFATAPAAFLLSQVRAPRRFRVQAQDQGSVQQQSGLPGVSSVGLLCAPAVPDTVYLLRTRADPSKLLQS